MKDYTKFMKWAVIYIIDRTQDDRKVRFTLKHFFPVQHRRKTITSSETMNQKDIFYTLMIWKSSKKFITVFKI